MFSLGADTDILPAAPPHALNPSHSGVSDVELEIENNNRNTRLPRSASYTQFSNVVANPAAPGFKRTFSENVLALPAESAPKSNANTFAANKELFRRASRKAKTKLRSNKSLSVDERGLSALGSVPLKSELGAVDETKVLKSVSGTLRNLTRRASWMPSTSRSPSPVTKEPRQPLLTKRSLSPLKKQIGAGSETNDTATSGETVNRPSSPSSPDEKSELSSKSPEITEIPRQTPKAPTHPRPQSLFVSSNRSESNLKLSRKLSTLSLRSHPSSELLSNGDISRTSVKVPPIPASIPSDRNFVTSEKKKDPLWGAFRALEADYQTYQSKSSAHKAKVIRGSLMPFLSKHADHPSNKILRAEDLDRRVTILNKWWTGLLEMLNGHNNQSISGTDRLVFLDAVSALMARPEWRIPPYSTVSPVDTPNRPSISQSKSTQSLSSTESDFLAETIHHNVRNTFVHNLMSQMVFAVDRLSMRNAPASLVSFCGKATAYGFFFCPGVADILVRLWNLDVITVRRIFAEAGIERGAKLDRISHEVAKYFPPPVRSLPVSSQTALVRHLQQRQPLPSAIATVNWYGPWIGRWSGRDSDLLFVFTKWFHILAAEHFSDCADEVRRICIPGLVPVHAQILSILETTIYRHGGQVGAEKFASNTVDDIDNPEASAQVPLTMANAARSMAENRLVMLLRDVVANTDPAHYGASDLYVHSFDRIMKAATRKVSLYNSNACFVLCDFMEEVVANMSRYHLTHPDSAILDWPFWLSVCRHMMDSRNSLTEVRVISFIYSIWNVLVSGEDQKREFCLGWLLEPVFFHTHFNHWCPMVRHYFLRLLCWRVARYDGDASDLDGRIYDALITRLDANWANYLYLNAEAEMLDKTPPSSAACTPAPNRRFVIIRTDSQPFSTSLLPSFDRLLSPSSFMATTPYLSNSSSLNSIPPADSPTQNKKRWSLLKNIMPFGTSPGNSRPGEVTPPPVSEEKPSAVSPLRLGGSSANKSRPGTPPHQAFSFKFSLEWLERPSWPAKNRRLTPPSLPDATQILIQMRRGPVQTQESRPLKPKPGELSAAKYSGRALAEWALIVQEYNIFHQRRKDEGVPLDRLIETPTLGVESFRMMA